MPVVTQGNHSVWVDDGSSEALERALVTLENHSAALQLQLRMGIEQMRKLERANTLLDKQAPESLRRLAEQICRSLPVASDSYHPFPGVTLGELRSWVGR